MAKEKNGSSSFSTHILSRAIVDAFKKLDPREQVKNFVMFVVFLGAIVTSFIAAADVIKGRPLSFDLQIATWLWFTVLFANFAEAIAEGRGKAQADSLRKTRTETEARLLRGKIESKVRSTDLVPGDCVLCEVGDVIPGDGEVVEGVASVDESAITGESAPVIRESGGDRSAVTGGTRILSDRIVVKITSKPGDSFLDKMISLVEGAKRQRTPNEVALSILLVALTAIFFVTVFTLRPFAFFSGAGGAATLPVLIALLVCLIPTTIGGLLSAIGISGMDRLLRRNILAMSGKAVEAAGDVDVLLLDKTGTITLGNRMASEFFTAPGINPNQLAEAACLASLADETAEGRSIILLAKQKYNVEVQESGGAFIPFSAKTRMSGVDITKNGVVKKIRKGASDSVDLFVKENGAPGLTPEIRKLVEVVARSGGTPLVVCENEKILGVVQLKDVVKPGIRERFARLRKMGIRTVMITGDNPLTAAAIAAEAGVDDFIAEATPEAKLSKISTEQKKGNLVAMVGDGTNDAPALAQADVGIAMNTGTQAAREAGNMVDLDSDPTKLIEVVEIGKQLLMTRGALTTFSISNDIAKYFAIIPAIFTSAYATAYNGGQNGPGPLAALNVMNLHSPESAILSAVIFNALIIVALIPLALKGVGYKPMGAEKVLARNIVIYGGGGILVPFVGIKLIDLLIVSLHLA